MSEPDKSEKTELPTPKKLRDLRQKGQVPKSKEVVAAAGLLGVFSVVLFGAESYLNALGRCVTDILALTALPFDQALAAIGPVLTDAMLTVGVPAVAAGLVVGILSNVMQFGFILAGEPVKPDLKRLDPVKGAKNLFSAKRLIDVGKAALKMIVLSTVCAWYLGSSLQDLLLLPYCGLACVLPMFGQVFKILFFVMLPLFIVIAGLDFMHARKRFTQDNKMTKDELKREFKNSDGNPEVKGERRRLQFELAMEDMAQMIAASSIVIAAAEVAVGIQYVRGSNPVPLVTFIARGAVVGKALTMARRRSVPVVKNSLARRLAQGAAPFRPVNSRYFYDVARTMIEAGALQVN